MDNKELHYLLANVENKIEIAVRRNMPIHTKFYNLAEQHHIENMLRGMDEIKYNRLGGYEKAERCIFAIYPILLEYDLYYLEPIKVVKINWNDDYYNIGHRDILGAILGLGIEREVLGDIIVNKNNAYVFVIDNMIRYISENLSQVGSAFVSTECLGISDIQIKVVPPKIIASVVPSLRLDCIISAGFKMSRTKSTNLIREGRVLLNWNPCHKPGRAIDPGDVITIRGMGRIRFIDTVRITQRDNLYIEIEIYK
ncbi:MAG: hypothetical protein GX974_04235 [Clostridiales bacterium]|nr:hypothetical protein [Clostridiales bacterium]